MSNDKKLLSCDNTLKDLYIEPERKISLVYNEPKKVETVYSDVSEEDDEYIVMSECLHIPKDRMEQINILPKEKETKAEHFLNMSTPDLLKYFESELNIDVEEVHVYPKKKTIRLHSTFFFEKENETLQKFFKDCPLYIDHTHDEVRLIYNISSWDKIKWED